MVIALATRICKLVKIVTSRLNVFFSRLNMKEAVPSNKTGRLTVSERPRRTTSGERFPKRQAIETSAQTGEGDLSGTGKRVIRGTGVTLSSEAAPKWCLVGSKRDDEQLRYTWLLLLGRFLLVLTTVEPQFVTSLLYSHCTAHISPGGPNKLLVMHGKQKLKTLIGSSTLSPCKPIIEAASEKKVISTNFQAGTPSMMESAIILL